MKDLRGPLPLTDADFATIRANVMTRVRPRRTSVFALRWAFAMLAAAFAGVFSYKSLVSVEPPPAVAPVVAKPPAVIEPVRITQETPSPLPPPAPRVARHRAATPQPLNQPIHQPTFRLEIQTSDPDIRIIWLPNNYDPKSEETSS